MWWGISFLHSRIWVLNLETKQGHSSGVRIQQLDVTQGHSVQRPRLLGESLLPLAPALMPLHDASLRWNTHRAPGFRSYDAFWWCIMAHADTRHDQQEQTQLLLVSLITFVFFFKKVSGRTPGPLAMLSGPKFTFKRCKHVCLFFSICPVPLCCSEFETRCSSNALAQSCRQLRCTAHVQTIPTEHCNR
jgi:hypothetical protein